MQFCRNLIWLENLGRALLLNRARVGSWSELKLALESLYRAGPLPSLNHYMHTNAQWFVAKCGMAGMWCGRA
jgi:hypothetical protein